MKKINLLFKTIFVLTVFTLISCEEEEFTLGAITAPTDVTLTAEIVGATADEPNGDGSGTVHFTVSGNGAITYKFSFDGEEKLIPTGKKTYNFHEKVDAKKKKTSKNSKNKVMANLKFSKWFN